MKILTCNSSIININNLSDIWQNNDFIVVLFDMDTYSIENTFLSSQEEIYLNKLKTFYFKKRYETSRTVLKYLISIIFQQDIRSINTFKDDFGRVHIENFDDLYICLGYTKNIVMLCISKIEIGTDIETVKLIKHKNIEKILKFGDLKKTKSNDFIKKWVLKEAYCKYSNQKLINNLTIKNDFKDIYSNLYIVDKKLILGIVTADKYSTFKIINLKK